MRFLVGLSFILLCLWFFTGLQPGLAQTFSTPFPMDTELPSATQQTAQQPVWNGLALAGVLLVLMLAAFIYVGIVLARAYQGKTLHQDAAWLDWSIPLLAVVGIAVAAYLTYVESNPVQAICGPIGDCNAVQDSRYARIFGILPVGVFGLAGYGAILAAWLWGRLQKRALSGYLPLLIFGFAVFGTFFSVYLTYIEVFVIKAVCIWCITSAVVITLLMIISLPPAARWLAASEDEE